MSIQTKLRDSLFLYVLLCKQTIVPALDRQSSPSTYCCEMQISFNTFVCPCVLIVSVFVWLLCLEFLKEVPGC